MSDLHPYASFPESRCLVLVLRKIRCWYSQTHTPSVKALLYKASRKFESISSSKLLFSTTLPNEVKHVTQCHQRPSTPLIPLPTYAPPTRQRSRSSSQATTPLPLREVRTTASVKRLRMYMEGLRTGAGLGRLRRRAEARGVARASLRSLIFSVPSPFRKLRQSAF